MFSLFLHPQFMINSLKKKPTPGMGNQTPCSGVSVTALGDQGTQLQCVCKFACWWPALRAAGSHACSQLWRREAPPEKSMDCSGGAKRRREKINILSRRREAPRRFFGTNKKLMLKVNARASPELNFPV